MISENNSEHIQGLADKWRKGIITEQEKAEFNNWYNSFNDNEADFLSDETPDTVRARMFKAINEKKSAIQPTKIRRISYFRRIAAAASLLLFIGAGYFLLHKHKPDAVIKDILPGSNRALLTLANGEKINLDSAANGQLAKQAGITVSKAISGHLVYTATGGQPGEIKPSYNTVETPKGGQYQVLLPDGTKVWLNAASSIRFPTVFSGNERNVTISGEAYFEVAHNKLKPFNVNVAGIRVHVLGTHFNINAYTDEDAVKTTLLQGSVALTRGASRILLIPGQQGKSRSEDDNFDIARVDTSVTTAWRNQMFVFDNTDLHSLMRQLSRWYNIDIVYQGDVPNDQFFGKIERKANLSKVLKILELGDVHFKIEDKKLIVMP